MTRWMRVALHATELEDQVLQVDIRSTPVYPLALADGADGAACIQRLLATLAEDSWRPQEA